jgi:hypothetical protein
MKLSDFNGCIIFTKWSGSNGIETYIKNITNCKPYSGAGINYRRAQQTTILKSVDNTYYYNDNLTDINNPTYTLFGHNGDQDEKEKKFNEPLLNNNKTKHIYLYRVVNINRTKYYIWYGKYNIMKTTKKPHIGKDYNIRKIVILTLQKI